MDAEMAKQFQRMLTKQGLKFKLSTKVVSGKLDNDKVILEIDAAKGGTPETVLSATSSNDLTRAVRSRRLFSVHWPSPIHRKPQLGSHQY